MDSSGSAWDQLVAQFTDSGLPLPPVPDVLRPALRAPQPWCWTTRDIDPTDMYMFDPGFVHDALAARMPDYVAVSHAGHGVNSYALNYHLVHGPLAVVMQVGWGGVYTDNAAAGRRLGTLWRRLEAMLAGAAPGTGRVLCVYSDIRGTSACGHVPTDPALVRGFLDRHRTNGEAAFDTAERLLART